VAVALDAHVATARRPTATDSTLTVTSAWRGSPLRLANDRVVVDVDTTSRAGGGGGGGAGGSVLITFLARSTASSNSTMVPILRSFHGARAGTGPGGALYRGGGDSAWARVLLHDSCFTASVGANTSTRASIVLNTRPCSPAAQPQAAPRGRLQADAIRVVVATAAAAPPPLPSFVPLGNADYCDGAHMVRIGAPPSPLVADAAHCEAICAATGGCVTGTYINGSLRHGECWLASVKLAEPRHDYCGVNAAQQCFAFANEGPVPPPSPPPGPPPPPHNETSALQRAVIEISLAAGDSAFTVNVTAWLGVSAASGASASSSAGSTSMPLEYLLSAFEWVASTPPLFVHTPHLKRVSKQHWGNEPSPEYVSGDRTSTHFCLQTLDENIVCVCVCVCVCFFFFFYLGGPPPPPPPPHTHTKLECKFTRFC
jgi:hypothetical protein